MTTIAYKDGIIAADSRVCRESIIVASKLDIYTNNKVVAMSFQDGKAVYVK